MGAIGSRFSRAPPPKYGPLSPSLCLDCSQHFLFPRGVAVEEETQNIFIASSCGFSIFTPSFQFITTFHHRLMVTSWGIALYRDTIYVTDYFNPRIFIFREDSGSFCVSTVPPGDNFMSPSGIAVSEEEIFIAERDSNRVEVLSSADFTFTRSISSPSMNQPIDLKLTFSELYVLSENVSPRMHVFSHAGTLLRRMDTRVRLTHDTLFGTMFFCLDPWGHPLVSDMPLRSLMAYSREGHPMGGVYVGEHGRLLSGLSFVNKHYLIVCLDTKLLVYSIA